MKIIITSFALLIKIFQIIEIYLLKTIINPYILEH